MKNAYAKEQAELRRQLLNYGALVGQQFNVDMMCLALNEEGFGHDRIMRIIHRAEKHGEYFHECLAYGVESDARFEQLDQRLRYICRDHPEDFVPREERYPNVKVPGMGKKIQSGTDRRMNMKNEEIVRALRTTEWHRPAAMSSMEAPSFCACLTEEFMNTVQREPRSTGWVEARAFCVNS